MEKMSSDLGDCVSGGESRAKPTHPEPAPSPAAKRNEV